MGLNKSSTKEDEFRSLFSIRPTNILHILDERQLVELGRSAHGGNRVRQSKILAVDVNDRSRRTEKATERTINIRAFERGACLVHAQRRRRIIHFAG